MLYYWAFIVRPFITDTPKEKVFNDKEKALIRKGGLYD